MHFATGDTSYLPPSYVAFLYTIFMSPYPSLDIGPWFNPDRYIRNNNITLMITALKTIQGRKIS